MEEKKFYYIYYNAFYAISGWQPIGEAIDKHPFFYIEQDVREWAKRAGITECRLTHWQEITMEEYDYALNSDYV